MINIVRKSKRNKHILDRGNPLKLYKMKTFLSIFAITALITHIWTTIIGFSEAGFIGGVLTLILPVLSEIYWMFKMFGENNTFAIVALIHLILSIPVAIVRKSLNNK